MTKDKILKCIDCKQDFAWTIEEQQYFAKKGQKPPIRCLICQSAFNTAKKDKFRGKRK